MATNAPITGARTRAPSNSVPFSAAPITPDSFGIGTPMLGCVMTMNDPLSYLEQAYALAVTLEDAASPETAMSEELVQNAARGVATLIHLASIAVRRIEAMDPAVAS